MAKDLWRFLQLFAEGEGGGEAATGDTAADPGAARLLELGVPANKIRKNRSYGAPQTAQPVTTEEQEEEPKQDDAAKEAPKRMTWEEIKQDPEYNQELQKVIKARLKKANEAQERLEALAPALEALANSYGIDPEKLDYAKLSEAITKDDRFYDERSLETGKNPEELRKDDLSKIQARAQQRLAAQQQQTMQEQMYQAHFAKLEQQGEAMKALFPSFDLRAELQNEAFARMTSPQIGLSVEDAYHAVHRKEIMSAAMEAAQKQAAEKISQSIQAGAKRPAEAGTASAAIVTRTDYRNMPKQEREALKRRIYAGEKIYPGR